jgi:hypothetical protein
MEKRCECKVGYVHMSEPKNGEKATLIDAQNIRLTGDTITCASCSNELYKINMEG